MHASLRWKAVALSAALAVVVVTTLSCGGRTANVGLSQQPANPIGHGSTDAAKGAGVVVHESEIASLPRWQQDMLSDPGWNQPYIHPAQATEIEAPTTEMLLRLTREKLAAEVSVTPRGFSPTGKSASWLGFGAPPGTVQGEYDGVAPAAIPPFGCNSDGSNSNGENALEDLIVAKPIPMPPASFVDSFSASPNYFCVGGTGNDMYSVVAQLFTDDPASDPNQIGTEWVELSYNAGLLGDPVGPGDACTAEAFSVTGPIWRCFNSEIDATPNQNPTELYNILIAPSGDEQGPVTSSGDSVAYYQPFYFGSVSNCYGGAWIVSIESTTSTCDVFREIFTDPETAPIAQDFFTNPVNGLLLKRWRDMSPDDTPWASEFGMPIFGPFAYHGGAPQLNNKGSYYAWGMWFERGFIWWFDYDNDGPGAAYPNATDEAVAYRFTGDNVFCGGDYIKMPTVYYGGQGNLGVSVVVQAQRKEVGRYWKPVEFTGTQYNIALGGSNGNIGFDTMDLSMFAQGFGGTPDADCNYKYYVWALRNGSIISAGAPFDPSQRQVTGTYGSDTENRESIYVVRVQITDAGNNIAYGDSFPIHIGDNGWAGGGGVGPFPIMIIDNDPDDLWPTNLQAIEDDLYELQLSFPDLDYGVVDYYDGIGDDAFDADVPMVLWYQGGPVSDSGEPYNTIPYTNEQAIALNSFRINGIPLVHFTQSAGIWDNTNWTGTDEHSLVVYAHQFDSILSHTLPETGGWTPVNFCEQIFGLYQYDSSSPTEPSWNSPVHGVNATDGSWYFGFAPFQRVVGEGYIGVGSSGSSYNGNGYGWQNMNLGQSIRCIITGGEPRNLLDYPGAVRGMGDSGFTFRSWGNTISRSYTIGYAWADLEITNGSPFTPTRAQTLQNIMASLDNNILGEYDDSDRSFRDYEGDDPAIVLVKPVFWNDDGSYIEGSASFPGTGEYPDDSGVDVFRNTPGAYNNEILRIAGNGDEDGLNGNDIDMQAPFYGYWHYGLDGITELGPDGTGDPADAVDDLMWAGGVLVHNVDADTSGVDDWQLYAGDPRLFGTPTGSRLVSGYYVNETGLDPAVGDGHVSAHYGFKNANLEFDGREGTVSFEAIARWAQTGSVPFGLEAHGSVPARLRWSLFPGHGVVVPNVGAGFPEYGKQLHWQQFLQNHDIANGGIGTYRDEAGYLRPSFSLGGNDSQSGGRFVDFDFRNILGWYTDFNGNFTHGDLPNGTDDPGDKFPYRARLITGWTAYLDNTVNQAAWPNRMPDPESFIELGGYLLDTSDGSPGMQIVDDLEQDDPYLAFHNSGWKWHFVYLYFEISGGTAPYEVFLDPAYDLETYDPLNPLATFDDVLGVNLSWTENNDGKSNEIVSWQDPEGGNRIFALKAVDATGTNMDFMFYPDPVTVGTGFRITDDPDEPDPGEEGTFRNENWPDVELDLYFLIIGGEAPYEVSFDPAYDLETFNPLYPLGTFDDVLGLDLTWTEINAGKNSETVIWQDPVGGMRTFAVRAIDATGKQFMYFAGTIEVGPPN